MKECKSCKTNKTIDDFYKYKRYRDGICKDCRNLSNRNWRNSNPQLWDIQKEKNKLKKRSKEGMLAKRQLRLDLIKNNKNLCSSCKEIKHIKNFSKSNFSKVGYDNRCKTCLSIINKNQKLKKEYNLTLEQFTNILNSQENCCAICKIKFIENMKMCVDHNHKENFVRGILCDNCNRGIGLLKDNLQTLYSAVKYLKASPLKIPLNGEVPEEDNPVLN